MKLNIANPSTGTQKLLDIDDEKKLRIFYDKYMSQEVKGDDLGEEFKGYVFLELLEEMTNKDFL